MKAETKYHILPLCAVVLICIFPIPYLIVQALPDSLTQQGWFVKSPDGYGGMEDGLVTYSQAGGLFRTSPASGVAWEASLFANRWYFSPIASVLNKMGWGSRYKFL